MLVSRRGLIVGAASLLAAPAIVRASSLMPVKAIKPRGLYLGTVSWPSIVQHTIDIPTYHSGTDRFDLYAVNNGGKVEFKAFGQTMKREVFNLVPPSNVAFVEAVQSGRYPPPPFNTP